MEFTYRELESVYDLFRQKGYRFSFFDDHQPEGVVFLRHDIDCSVSKALEMARFEKDHGLASTFFVQPDNDFYNPFCARSLELLHQVLSLGHKIGLHISPSNCRNEEALGRYIEHTYNYLSEFLPVERVFSFHRPGSYDGWQDIEITRFINTYHKKFFKEIFYFSDSNRREFMTPDFLEAPSTGKSIQFLTHTIWWSEKGIMPNNVALNIITEIRCETKLALSRNIKIFQGILKTSL